MQPQLLRHEGFNIAGLTVRTSNHAENDPHFAKSLLSWGVDTVVTDRPDIVRA